MSDVLETFTSEDGLWRVQVCQDDDCGSPREDTQLGTLITWDRNYNSPDDNEFSSPDSFEAWWSGKDEDEDGHILIHHNCPAKSEGYIRLPVFKYEHSGVAYRTSDFGDRWDSGQVGWIFSTPESIEETGAPIESIARQLKNEVEEYSKWANGECYGYVVTHKIETCDKCHDTEWEDVDSCWGFVGRFYGIPFDTADLPPDLKLQLEESYYFEESA